MTAGAIRPTMAIMPVAMQEGGLGSDFPAMPPNAALFLDVDGTLVPIEAHPQAVSIDAGLRDLLGRLSSANQGALALISGRSIADIDALFLPATFAVAGQHGAERRGANGVLHSHAPPSARLLQPAEELRALVRRHPGLLLEEKGASLALHYRAAPVLGDLVDRETRRIGEALGEDFERQAGKFVVEIKPSGRDKGTAIAAFMAEAPFAGRTPVFVGDDLTDELGFAYVNTRGGMSVKVGPGDTCAQARLA